MLLTILLVAATGCAAKDFVWGIFGNAYSDGGTTDYDRNDHYEQKLEGLNHDAAAEGW